MATDAADQLVAGHRNSLALLADTGAVRVTLDRYRAAAGVDVYLRPTGKGLTVMSLDVANCRSMISVGTRGRRDDVLRSLPPADDQVAAAAAGYLAKRDGLGRGSIEERFSLGLIADALQDRLLLGGTGWLFLHQEWRLRLREGPGKIDLLAFDPERRRLTVIECKATERDSQLPDQHGWPAARQADEYAAVIWRARHELYPFFGELARAMARLYAPTVDVGSLELDPALPPTTAVWWPGHTPAWPAWDATELRAHGDSPRVAGYRALQSRFRQEVLGVGPGPRPGKPSAYVGNMLNPADVAADPTLNFVDDGAYRHALDRSTAVQAEGGTLEVDRLFQNLLSSMPMCFNIFGSLRAVSGFVEIFRCLFDADADRVVEVLCEVKPSDSLRDRTAFDAFVRYDVADGGGKFVGIETKYTEAFSPTVYDTPTYRAVTESCGWFLPGAADALSASATNQLWRGVMLAALVEAETEARGRYAVVAPADDVAVAAAVDTVAEYLHDPSRLLLVTLEELVDASASAADPGVRAWAAAFGRRYLLRGQ